MSKMSKKKIRKKVGKVFKIENSEKQRAAARVCCEQIWNGFAIFRTLFRSRENTRRASDGAPSSLDAFSASPRPILFHFSVIMADWRSTWTVRTSKLEVLTVWTPLADCVIGGKSDRKNGRKLDGYRCDWCVNDHIRTPEMVWKITMWTTRTL